jgi:hypothetical protein
MKGTVLDVNVSLHVGWVDTHRRICRLIRVRHNHWLEPQLLRGLSYAAAAAFKFW